MAVLLATGCATESGSSGRHDRQLTRYAGGGPAGVVARSAVGAAVRLDAFEQVLLYAGLDLSSDLPPSDVPLTPEDAAALYEKLLDRPVTLAGFGPRRVAGHLLREVMEGDGEVRREELLSHVRRFEQVAVLRPDGYLAWALSGRTQQKVGPVAWKEGSFRSGQFELGRFYSGRGGAFRSVDERLRPLDTPLLAEVYDDADYLGRTLDGAEEAFVELVLAMGQLVSHPLDSVAALRQLPEGVAALIASSPAYLERLRHMTRGEQIQALSKLCTALVATWGTAAGTTRNLANVARGSELVSVTALSLTVDGALIVERVSVPAGRVVTVMGGGPGAAIILQRANAVGGQPAPSGPGQWAPSHETMSRRAARYQEQISGRPVSEAYWVGGTDPKRRVRFDGFEDGVLLEAKGLGYANKFLDSLEPKRWFLDSGARGLIEQARRQRTVANGTPIRWHVAEEKAADAIRKLLKEAKVSGIEVVHTPMLP